MVDPAQPVAAGRSDETLVSPEATDLLDSLLGAAEWGAAAGASAGVPLLSIGEKFISWVRERRRFEQAAFAEHLAGRLVDHAALLDRSFIRSEEAAGFVVEVVEKGARRREIDKREFYASALVNGLSRERPAEDLRFRMIDTLERFRPPHLLMLARVMSQSGFRKPYGAVPDVSENNGVLTGLMEDDDFERLSLDWRDLVAAGIVTNLPGDWVTGRTDYRGFITDFGLVFHQFVRVRYGDVHPPRDGRIFRDDT